jgi:hypothetical protein
MRATLEAASPWAFGWEGLVAIGTLALALVTAGLAISTHSLARKTAEEVDHSKRQVEAINEQAAIAQDALAASREQVEVSQRTLEAEMRPVLVDVTRGEGSAFERVIYPGYDGSAGSGQLTATAHDQHVLISVPVRNVGPGLGLMLGATLQTRLEIGQPPCVFRPSAIPPGEAGRVSFRATPGSAAFAPLKALIEGQEDFSVEVLYTDVAGRQATISRLDVVLADASPLRWRVRQVHFQSPDAREPFAATAPGV